MVVLTDRADCVSKSSIVLGVDQDNQPIYDEDFVNPLRLLIGNQRANLLRRSRSARSKVKRCNHCVIVHLFY